MTEKPGFDAFWKAYPKRVSKVMARKAWNRIPWIEEHYFEVIEAVEGWKQTDQWQDPQFIPYPATFLNQRRWEGANLEAVRSGVLAGAI